MIKSSNGGRVVCMLFSPRLVCLLGEIEASASPHGHDISLDTRLKISITQYFDEKTDLKRVFPQRFSLNQD